MEKYTNLKFGIPKFRAGDWVEVKSAEEILATLDDRGRLDALPFMPEMLQHCGKRFRVYKSAHKTCDTIENYKIRRITDTVHLDGLRCDGTAHDGCQAGCLLFWKNAWLRPVGSPKTGTVANSGSNVPQCDAGREAGARRCNLETLDRATRTTAVANRKSDDHYSCQATELLNASRPLKWWAPWPYVLDLLSRNVRLRDFVRYTIIAAYNAVMRLHWRGRPYPYIRGLVEGKTPAEKLNLQPGEMVQVRSKKEIIQTINASRKNRGLLFDGEMLPFCGKTFRVLRRVKKIVDEKTGSMINIPNDCLILEGVTCSGCLSRDRLFCPRSIYPYWHEIWLKRVDGNGSESKGVAPDYR